MLGGAKPPISGHRSGPKPRGPGFLRGEASPSHQLKGLGERCIDLSSSSGAPAEPGREKGFLYSIEASDSLSRNLLGAKFRDGVAYGPLKSAYGLR